MIAAAEDPRDKIVHVWFCSRRSVIVEKIIRTANGQAQHVIECANCTATAPAPGTTPGGEAA